MNKEHKITWMPHFLSNQSDRLIKENEINKMPKIKNIRRAVHSCSIITQYCKMKPNFHHLWL